MNEVLLRWLIGLVGVSTVLGFILSYYWYQTLAKLLGVDRKITGWKNTLIENGVLTGIIERAFFTIAIATCMSGGIITAMVLWTTLKSKTLWAGFMGNKCPTEVDDNRVLVSLLASLGSMIIAIVAGKICSGAIL